MFLAAAMVCLTVTSTSSKFEPLDGKTILVVGQDIDAFSDYLSAVGPMPGGWATYTSIGDGSGLSTLSDVGGGRMHAQAMVIKYPNTVVQLGIYMVRQLEAVNAGKLDPVIDRIGRWIKQTKRPVYVRIGYEFDYPENFYEPKAFVQAFRHIVDRLRAENVDNAAYVWHSYASGTNRPILDWYPGDEYVDWFAVSYFDQKHDYLESFADLAKARRKPLMIAESAPMHIGVVPGSSASIDWFQGIFSYIGTHDVKMFCYINCDWAKVPIFATQGWGDSRIKASPEVMELWKKEVAKERYLKSSPKLFRDLGFRLR